MLCIGVIGLGYVGLPVALSFAAHYPVIGYDIDEKRIHFLQQGNLPPDILSDNPLDSLSIQFTHQADDLAPATVFIITVPTPIGEGEQPDLSAVQSATATVARYLSKGALVILESTVYPGTTESVCLPILESGSGLQAGVDFDIAYSPERINPGDPHHTLSTLTKVVAGLTERARVRAHDLYALITAEVIDAQDIKVAEAAKLLENTQRDVNIALMNEMAMICQSLSIDTQAVIKTASTKWNFHPYQPGLVGGHCISVDPHYLRYVAARHNLPIECVSAARKTNDSMMEKIADWIIQSFNHHDLDLSQIRVGVLGITFKENCSDLRNSGAVLLIRKLQSTIKHIFIHDPLASPEQAKHIYQLELTSWESLTHLDAIVVAVGHHHYRQISIEKLATCFGRHRFLFDVKRLYSKEDCVYQQIHYWGL